MSQSQNLSDIAKALVVDGKGILAADESSPTIKKRFDKDGISFPFPQQDVHLYNANSD